MSIGNLPRSHLLATQNKFLVTLVPKGVDVQDVLAVIVPELKRMEVAMPSFFFNKWHQSRRAFVRIARVIGDLPGVATFLGLLSFNALYGWLSEMLET